MENFGTPDSPSKTLEKPDHFEVLEDHAVFRSAGRFTLEYAVRSVTSAIVFAREHQIKKLLLDVTGVFGFEKPAIADRYFFVREWAAAARGQVCLSVVTKPKWRDYEDIDVTMAENVGIRAKVFLSEKEALDWLQNVSCVVEAGRIEFTRG